LANYDQSLVIAEDAHVILDQLLTRNEKRKEYIPFLWG